MFRPTKVIDPKTPINKMCEEVNQNIQVFVRCRPLNSHEKKSHVELIPEKRSIKTNQQNKAYLFDHVFDSKAKQLDIYRAVVEPLVEQVIEGYNCTVFAYGQTGTGKTYTMIGKRSDKHVSWDEDPTSGIIPRAIDQLLDDLENQNTEYTVRVSYLELYNEDAYDLLSPLSDTTKLRIYNDQERKGSVIISGLVEIIVKTKAEIFEILEKGSLKRQTAPTLMNACSSRSHSIFSITVHIKEVTLDGQEVVKMGKLNLVDLAGSENIGRSGAVEERAREASNINKSLLTLGRVITSLVEKSSHIPYRDSKLTRLLQDSLGGKTKTSIIATISPSTDDIEDTISTLDYAQRAKKITNKPEINLKMSKKTLFTEYLDEIEKLRRDLEAARDKKGIYVDAKNYAEMEATIKTQEQSLEVKEARIEYLKEELDKHLALFSESNENFQIKCEELEVTKKDLEQVSAKLSATIEYLEVIKMELQEQKILVEAHKNTEDKLLNQAKTIITVTDKCVEDNSRLFKKIDSYTDLENYNSDILNRFMADFTTQIDKINNLNSIMFSTIGQGYNSIESLVENNKEEVLNRETELKSNSNQIEKYVDDFATGLFQLIQEEKDVTKISLNIKSMLTSFKAEISESFNSKLTSIVNKDKNNLTCLDEIMSESLKNRSSLEEIIMAQISKINETSKHVLQTISSINEDYVQNFKEKCIEVDRLKFEINELKNVVENIKLDSQLKQMVEYINKISEEYQDKVGLICDSLNSFQNRVNIISSSDSNFKNFLSHKSDEFINFYKNEEKSLTSALSRFDLQNNQNCQFIVDKCTNIKKNKNNIYSDYEDFSKETLSHTDNTLKNIDSQINNIDLFINKSVDSKKQSLDDFVRNMVDLSKTHVKKSEDFISNFSESQVSILNEYRNMESYCEALKTSQDIQIKDFINIGKEFTESGYQVYQVTGSTPKKCSYSYPKDLCITSPHEKIIAKFKNSLKNQICNSDDCLENNSTSDLSSSDLDTYKSDCENLNDLDLENNPNKLDSTYFVKENQQNGFHPLAVNKRKHLKEKN